MSVWKDSKGDLHDDMNGAALSLPNWPAGMIKLTDEEVTAARTPTTAQRYSAELAALSNTHNEQRQKLNMAWVAACVMDATSEETKKAAITAQVNAVEAKYNADLAALKAKYGV